MTKILMAAAELAPIAPTGGIAQYLSGLTRALQRAKHEVKIALPPYRFLLGRADLQTRGGLSTLDVDGIEVLLLGDDRDFADVTSHTGIYRPINFERWIGFARSVSDFVMRSNWRPQIVHCHDAQASLVPCFLSQRNNEKVRTVFTIHNLLNKGIGKGRTLFESLGLPEEVVWQNKTLPTFAHFEYYGDTSCLKAALRFADAVTTVSRTYAGEIKRSDEYGFGLEGVLRYDLNEEAVGIVNGIDNNLWRFPGLKYDGSDKIGEIQRQKWAARDQLIPMWANDRADPVVGFKARWDRQKGIKLFADSAERILECTRVILQTWGERVAIDNVDVAQQLDDLRSRYPTRLLIDEPAATLGPSPAETGQLYAISDFFLMPSIYEPCGLAQMECQRYGCVPIVRNTGGLADTVKNNANGFTFNTLQPDALVDAMRKAVAAFASPPAMSGLIANALQENNDWSTRIAEYTTVYEGKRAVGR